MVRLTRELGFGLALLGSLLGACSEEEAVWHDDSQSVELVCSSFWQGSMKFRAARSELSAEQLQALGKVRTTDGNDGCPEDTLGCRLSITNSAGATASYIANQGDSTCDSDEEFVKFSTVEALLSTISCRSAKAQNTGPLAPDGRCFNGLFTTGSGTLRIPLASPGPEVERHLELAECAQSGRSSSVSMQLVAIGSTAPLATGTAVSEPGADGLCLALDAKVPPGSELVVTTSAFQPAGDFFLRYH